jgi:hypothetical protein
MVTKVKRSRNEPSCFIRNSKSPHHQLLSNLVRNLEVALRFLHPAHLHQVTADVVDNNEILGVYRQRLVIKGIG